MTSSDVESGQFADTARLEQENAELRARIEELERQRLELRQLLLQKELKEAELENKALTDSLTGLPNRSALEQYYTNLQNRLALSPHTPGSSQNHYYFLMLDLNDFKLINDQEGHLRGDQAIKAAVDALYPRLRKDRDDFFGRMGGDEFAIIVKAEDPSTVLERLDDFISGFDTNAQEPKHEKPGLSFSFGQVEIKPGDQFEQVYQRADQMMYEAKAVIKKAREGIQKAKKDN